MFTLTAIFRQFGSQSYFTFATGNEGSIHSYFFVAALARANVNKHLHAM